MELTFKIPEELEDEVRSVSKVELSIVILRLLKAELEKLKRLKTLTAGSKLSEEDAIALGREVNASMHRKYKKRYPSLR